MVKDYSDVYIRELLNEVTSIAVVGASSKPHRDSYKVVKRLMEYGYRVIPVNPNEIGNNIMGQTFYADLTSINEPIDMVDVFRSSDAVMGIAQEAIEISLKLCPALNTGPLDAIIMTLTESSKEAFVNSSIKAFIILSDRELLVF